GTARTPRDFKSLVSTNSTTRATQIFAMVTPSLIGLCRENEAYFNGLIYLVNNKFYLFDSDA
ncbi:TPA: hypothetical protein ACN98A_004584, partial [Vibrio parahaemolyticus]